MARKKPSGAPVMEVMAAPDTETAEEKKTAEPAFTKQKLTASKRFGDRRDALSAVLKDDRKYTIAETQELLDNFMKGKV